MELWQGTYSVFPSGCEDLFRNDNSGIISAVNFTVPAKLLMAHLAFSDDSRRKRMQDCVDF